MNSTLVLLGAAVVAGAYFVFLRRGGDVSGEAARKLVAGGARLLDVRTRGEFASGHLPGAVNIPLQELGARLKDAGAKDQSIVVYCLSGQRSAQAKHMLTADGFSAVHDLGAMNRW